MFNLVKIQEDLKGLPTQAIMGYANGQNPQVPPYIALAELNRRKQLEQSIQAGQQQPQQQGTIKEQIEQGVGLQSLQAQRQKQAMQAIGQQAMNAPAANPPSAAGLGALPAGAAAPQAQAFKGGGIVSFAAGGDPETEETEAERKERLQREADRASMGSTLKKMGAAAMDIATLPGRGVAGAFETGVTRPLRALGVDIPYLPESFYGGDASSMTPYYDKIRREEAAQAQPAPAQAQPAPAPAAPPQAQAQPRPPAPRRPMQTAPTPATVGQPQAAQAGIASIAKGQTDAFGTQMPQAPTMKEGFSESMGITEPYMKEEQAARKEYYDLLQRQQAEREKNAAWDRLSGFLGGFDSGGTGNWRNALVNANRAYSMTSAEQRRIKEEADREIAKEKIGIASIPAGYAKTALKEGADFKTKVYGDQMKGFGYLSNAAGTKYSVDAHLKGVMAQVRQRAAESGDLKMLQLANAAAQNYTNLINQARQQIAEESKLNPRLDEKSMDAEVIRRAQQALPPHQKKLLFADGMPASGLSGNTVDFGSLPTRK